tara:strand:- start:19 stop:324 length:306 start_codon:yes stop_codon:yes gene_type:complete
MKKLLLITFLFLITPDAKADMDYVCITSWDEADDFILENCVRNNILMMTNIPDYISLSTSAVWCRQDREINIQTNSFLGGEKTSKLSCVLYDNKPRKPISK